MLTKMRNTLIIHIKKNANKYLFLFLAFIIGVSAGAFTVNGLSSIQRDELTNYFQGFLQLLSNQKVDNGALLSAALIENLKVIGMLWILGLTIIGIPFIYVLVGIRGFITGFTSGFIIQTLAFKGVLFTLLSILPKEIVIVPCLIALGVNGINFSLDMIKNKSIKHVLKDNLKTNFVAYCMTTMILTFVIFLGILIEVYIIPVFVRMIAPTIVG
ncbi:MAG: stage II sporulation protein M [Bacillota bacterium]|nr:stage II sporulation protein M [Bacillota bacterium]